MTNFKKKVYILGGNHSNTYGLICSFRIAGIFPHVIVLSETGSSWIIKSLFVKKYWVVKTKEEILRILAEEGRLNINKSVILATSDSLAVFLDENYQNLDDAYILSGCKYRGEMHRWVNKISQYKLASKYQIPYAQTWIIENKLIPQDITYPCLTKPVDSIIGGKNDQVLCNTEYDLKEYLYKHSFEEIIVQRYINKKCEVQLLGCSLDSGSLIIIPGMTYKPLTSKAGSAYYLEYNDILDDFPYLNNCRKILSELGYTGLFSIEFLVDEQSKYYFLEINLRNDGNGLITTLAGSNLSYLYYMHVLGYEINYEDFKVVKKYSMMRGDSFLIYLLKNKGKGFLLFVKLLLKTNSFFVFNIKDPLPFLFFIWGIIENKLKQLSRKCNLLLAI